MINFIYNDGKDSYRVREENVGCSVFTRKKYVEGDTNLLNMLIRFNDLGVEKTLDHFTMEFPDEEETIKKDIVSLFDNFVKEDIFTDTRNKILTYFGERDE